jgi:uncharacterized coiled-coil protein SlyX
MLPRMRGPPPPTHIPTRPPPRVPQPSEDHGRSYTSTLDHSFHRTTAELKEVIEHQARTIRHLSESLREAREERDKARDTFASIKGKYRSCEEKRTVCEELLHDDRPRPRSPAMFSRKKIV